MTYQPEIELEVEERQLSLDQIAAECKNIFPSSMDREDIGRQEYGYSVCAGECLKIISQKSITD